ncbi:MAG TPA: O-antigen ligase family protein [Bryobacteraceae bacterium]|nr:O-antigen ligase family protein [Bryobacteraceae bacterium]
MRFLVPLVAALVPLLITPGLLSYFDVTPKIVILLFGVALISLYPRENSRNIRALLATTAGRWFAALLAVTWAAFALAASFSRYDKVSVHGGTWRRLGMLTETGLLLFVLTAAAWMAADRNNVRTLLRWCTASGGLGAVYGIFQYFGWDPLLPAKAYQVGEGAFTIVRSPGTLGHADYFAAWLVAIVPLALTLDQIEGVRWRKTIARAVAVLAIAAIVLSGTRSAILGLAIGAIAFAVLRRSRIRIRVIAFGLALAAAFALFFFSPLGVKLRARLYWSLDDPRGGARLLLWRDSLRMAGSRPWAGFGPETFSYEFPRFESLELARAYPDFYHESPHNIFLDALTGEGLLGLLALLGLCGLALWAIPRTPASLSAGFVAALACLQFNVFVLATALYFYLLLALLAVTTLREAPVQGSAARWSRWLWPLGWIAGLVLAVFALQLVAADRYLQLAQRAVAAGNVEQAAQAYRAYLQWNVKGAGADLDYSRAMEQLAIRTPLFATRLAARQQALEAGARATSTADDRQNAWYNLAMLFAAENDTASVERSLRNAIAWAPNWFKPHWTLAQLLEITGRHQEALAEAAAAVERDGGHDPEVTETLRKLQQKQAPR